MKFLSIAGHREFSSEMACKLFELDRLFFPTPWKLEAWNSLFEQDRLLMIVMFNEMLIGFCLFDKSVADNFGHLLKILIIPDYRTTGLAKKLLSQSIAQLGSEGCNKLFLEVEESNCAAQRLYFSLGFKVIHKKKHFYGTDSSALIMTKEE